MNNQYHKIHRLQPKELGNNEYHPAKLNIPAANIINLKKLQKEKNAVQASKKRGEAIIGIFRNFFRIRNNFHKNLKKHKPEASTEQVVIIKTKAIDNNASEQKSQEEPSTEKLNIRQFQLAPGWPRRVMAFGIFCLLIILPICIFSFYRKAANAKGEVLGISSEALDQVKAAGNETAAANFNAASSLFDQASQSFSAAEKQMTEAGGLFIEAAKLIPGQARSANELLSAGTELSQVGSTLTQLAQELDKYNLDPLAQGSATITDFLSLWVDNLQPISQHLQSTADHLANVRAKDLPKEYQDKFSQIQDNLPVLLASFNKFKIISEALLPILGQETPKRYLLVFENSRELRPSGGFIGSIALVDVDKGRIENMEVPGGGIYDLAGQLKEKIIAPKPLWLINPNWNIQDSNWFVDWPISAQKLAWFYERTGGASVDGVIALTPQVIESLLQITGPIDMQADYGVTVDQDNFVRQAQTWAEIEYDRQENKPKKFIGDLLPLLLNKVFQSKTSQLLSVVNILNSSLSDKNLLAYFFNNDLENTIASLGWSGQVKSTSSDYLQVVSSNIGGGKTDHVIDQLINHQASIQADGSIMDTVSVTRIHRGNSLDRWAGVANVSYLRFYVPAGSQLVSAEGFTDIPASRYQLPDSEAVADGDLANIEKNSIIDEKTNTRITSEFDKTVYGNWLSLDPGQSKTVTLTYCLPFKLSVGGLFNKSDAYSLLVQKQPGAVNNFLISQVVLDKSYQVAWLQPGVNVNSTGVEFITDLNSDKYYGVVLKK